MQRMTDGQRVQTTIYPSQSEKCHIGNAVLKTTEKEYEHQAQRHQDFRHFIAQFQWHPDRQTNHPVTQHTFPENRGETRFDFMLHHIKQQMFGVTVPHEFADMNTHANTAMPMALPT